MTDFALINLASNAIIGTPGPLPELFMPRDRVPVLATLADLSFTKLDYGGAYDRRGFWPVVVERASLGEFERHAAEPSYRVDAGSKTVAALYAAEALPAETVAEIKKSRIKARLAATDAGMALVVEELAEGAALSKEAQARIVERKKLREELADLDG